MSPTQRTLAKLRADGWLCEIVEHWNPFARRRIDLLGGIDILALKPGELLGVQCTTATNQSKRLAKLKAEPRIAAWLSAGGKVAVWAWALRGPRGARKRWDVTITQVEQEQGDGN